jgi:hypothetical protein
MLHGTSTVYTRCRQRGRDIDTLWGVCGNGGGTCLSAQWNIHVRCYGQVPLADPSAARAATFIVLLKASVRNFAKSREKPSTPPLKRSPACPTLPCQEFPMGVGPQTPLGCFRGWSPAGTCRNIYADRRARLRQTVLVPAHPLRSTKAVVGVAQLCSVRASCSDRRFHTQTTAPSDLAARLPPHSPPNPTFALLAEYRGLPVSRPAQLAPLRADLQCRCIGSHAASPVRRSARETPSDRLLRGESRRSDGKANALRSCRADLAPFRGWHALGTSVRRWGCAGRSYPSHWTSRSPPT